MTGREKWSLKASDVWRSAWLNPDGLNFSMDLPQSQIGTSSHQVANIQQSVPLAQSARILAHLARRGRLGTMAVTAVEPPFLEPTPKPAPPPEVITTPCDPWPRPYYLEGGLRRVAPYHFTYNTNCKQRWRGREILEIFGDEFRDRPVEYYVRRQSSCSVCLSLTDCIESCHRIRRDTSERQTGAFDQYDCQEWRHHQPYVAST